MHARQSDEVAPRAAEAAFRRKDGIAFGVDLSPQCRDCYAVLNATVTISKKHIG
jgi:hypothetical protein